MNVLRTEMEERFSRTAMLLGEDAIERLKGAHVAVFGVGGVGGYALEGLARCGVGRFTLVDNDRVSVSNINRQIIATQETVGQSKVEVAKSRVLSINPTADVRVLDMFFLPENADEIDFTEFDYVVDAIDTVSGKIELVLRCAAAGVPLISSMGTGNKLDPTMLEVTDIYKTSVCPLARVMRTELKKRGVKKLKVVYSKEEPIKSAVPTEEAPKGRRSVPGSVSFVPSVAGLIIAGEVARHLAGKED